MTKLSDDLCRGNPKHKNQVINLTVGIPPSVNHAYMNVRGGGKRLTKDAEKWMYKNKASVLAQLEDQMFKEENVDVWWVVEMRFYFPDLRIRDNHNTLKVLFDSIENTFFNNDYFVLPRVIFCKLDRKNPRLEMKIYPQKEKELNV